MDECQTDGESRWSQCVIRRNGFGIMSISAGLLVHLQHGFIRMEHCLTQQLGQKGVAEGLQVGFSCQHHPVGHGVALQVDPQPLPHLLLPVQWQCFSTGFCEMLNMHRLEEAARLLKQSTLSMTEIAGQVGFSTIRTFNAAFKKRFSMTPSEYSRSMECRSPAEPSC